MAHEASRLDALRQRLRAPSSSLTDVVGVGECSLDEVWILPGETPPSGGKVRARQRETLGGGQVATALVACARLGLKTAFAGAVGDDPTGTAVLAGLSAEGVDVGPARVVAGGGTRAALLLVDARGERTVIEHVDRRVVVPHDALPAAAIATARVLHLDATHLPTSLAAARLAREHGAIVSLDVDHVVPGLDELIALSDLCITSEAVPAQLTGEADLEQALRRLARLTPGLVGCTLGARGAMALDGGHLLMSPAFAADVVDTTACGDTFHAAAICAFLDGKSVGELLRFANAAASLKCRALGRTGCPRKPEIDELLARV
jgi:sulfofructose kinase